MVNPNTKGFDHFTDEAFYYGWCENCGLGVALTDKEEIRNEILEKYHRFKKENDVTASPFGKNFLEKSIAPYFAGITSVIGLLILLTGLLNFFQFLTGSYLNRSHEFGIRKATGSGDRQLFGLLFTQAVFISLIAFLFTFSMIEMLSPFLSFSLFNFTLLVERNLLLTQTTEYMAGILLSLIHI